MILPAAGEDLAGPGTVATPPGRMLGRAAFLPRRLKCQSGPNSRFLPTVRLLL